MSSLRDVAVAQIQRSAAENAEKERKRQEVIQREAEQEARDQQAYEKELQKQFLHDQKLLAGCLNILKFIAASLEKDLDFSPLRDKIIKIITDNPHNNIREDIRFSVVSSPEPPYRILFEVFWYPKHYTILFTGTNRNDNLHLDMDLFRHRGSINIPFKFKENEAVTEIIKFLMTV